MVQKIDTREDDDLKYEKYILDDKGFYDIIFESKKLRNDLDSFDHDLVPSYIKPIK